MLETIREYALDHLDQSGETAMLRRLHFEQYLALAVRAEPHLVRSDAAGWLERLESDHDNLRAALAWSGEAGGRGDPMGRLAGPLWWFWWMRNYFTEGRRWLDRALERTVADATRIKVLEGAGVFAFFRDDLGRADALLAEMASLARACHDDAATVSALAWHAYTARHQGNIVDAEARCAEAAALARRTRDEAGLAFAMTIVGTVANGQADFGRGVEALEEGLRAARRDDAGSVWMPHVLQNLARAYGGLGDLDKATACALEAREAFGKRADAWGLETCDRLLMRLARLRGDAEQGAILARDNLILNRDLGIPGSIAQDLDALGWIARVHGEHARAVRLFSAATAVRESIGRTILAESRKERDEDLAVVQRALGPAGSEAAWAEGQSMTLDQAIAYALEEEVST